VATGSAKYVPVCVCPWNEVSRSHLVVKTFCDLTSEEERDIKRTITDIFSAELDLSVFYRKASEDSHFSPLVKRLFGLKPYLSQDPFEALIKAVVRQLVRADAARRSISLLVVRFGERRVADGKEFYGFPSAETLSRAEKRHLIECKIGYKWKLVKELSNDVATGDLDFSELRKLSNEKVAENLTEYRGVGKWTAGIFLYDGLRRLNSYPIRDISVRKAVSQIYYRGEPVSWKEVEAFFEDYKGFVGIAVNYLFGALWLEKRLSCYQRHQDRKLSQRLTVDRWRNVNVTLPIN